MSTILINIPLEILYQILILLSYNDIINVCQSDSQLVFISKDKLALKATRKKFGLIKRIMILIYQASA